MTDEQKKKIYTDAFNNEENNGGCCQCVLGSIMENCGGVSESTFQAATAMAAGVGRNGSACGGCTGAILAIGSFLGRDYENFATEKGQQLKADSSLLARKVVEKFEKEYGSMECRFIQEKLYGRSYKMYDTEDFEKFIAAGGHGPNGCTNVVAKAALWTAEILDEAGLLKK